MSTSINTMNNNIHMEITGTGMVSMEAYAEFDNLCEKYENYEDVFNIWTVNPFFHMSLYNYYKAKGMNVTASDFKEQMMKHSYYISPKGINVYNLSRGEKFTVSIEVTHEDGKVEITEYTDNAAWEVLRDLSTSVVMNF